MSHPKMTPFLAMALVAAFTGYPLFNRDKDELEGIDVDKEMDLIRQKKSGLTARQRRMVEYRYELKHAEETRIK